MRNRCFAFLLVSVAPVLSGANWISGQAARAVIGQPSFSAHEPGLDPIALSLNGGNLYVADANGRVLAFSLEDVLGGKSGARCAVCFTSPRSITPQSVSRSSARFASYGKSIVAADRDNGRVLYWRDSATSSGPDVVLSIPGVTTVALDGDSLYAGDPAGKRVQIWKTATLNSAAAPDAILSARDGGAASIAEPVALVSDGTSLFVADAAYHRVLVFMPGEAAFTPELILSTASQTATALAPGALISIRASRLADRQEAAIDDGHTTAPGTLAGVELFIDGRPIPMMAASSTEIRAQVPYDVTYTANASVSLRWNEGARAGRASASVAVPVRSVAPNVFAFGGNASEMRRGVLLHGTAAAPVTAEDPAIPGETLLIWAAGLGSVDAPDASQPIAGKPFEGIAAPVHAEVRALVNGEPVEVLSAVLPEGALGIYEVRIALPRDTPPSATVTLSLREFSVSSNTVSFPLSRTRHIGQ